MKEEQIKKNQTKIIWPDLPEIEYKRTADGKAISATGELPEVDSKRKKITKPSVKDIISPSKSGTQLKKGQSLVNLFPAASDSTKDFIVELEHREREVAKLKANSIYSTISSKSKKSKKKKKKAPVDSVDYGERNLEEADWGGSGYYDMEDSKSPNMFMGDNFGTRPGTSANSSRGGGTGQGTRPNTVGLTGLEGPNSSSIVEEVGDHSTEDVAEEII